MPQVVWSRSWEGEHPELLLGQDRILVHATVRRAQQVFELRCYDFEGNELWSRPDRRVLLTLPGGYFLVATPEGNPLVLQSNGHVLHYGEVSGVERAVRRGDMLLFGGEGQVWAADLDLRPLWRMDWPGSSPPVIDCFVDGFFYWVEEGSLRRRSPGGQAEVFSPLPQDLIGTAMDEHERTTGLSALGGYYISPGMNDFAAFKKGGPPFRLLLAGSVRRHRNAVLPRERPGTAPAALPRLGR
jgi:hypothetical protein